MSARWLLSSWMIFALVACGGKDEEVTKRNGPPPRAERLAAAKRERLMAAASKTMPEPKEDVSIPDDAQLLPSGLATKVLRPGTGTERASEQKRVEVDYTIWTSDGARWFSTERTGKPVVFPLDAMIAGWQEGMKLMTVGEKRRLWIPEHLAYEGKEPRGAVMIDVELLRLLELAEEKTPDAHGHPAH